MCIIHIEDGLFSHGRKEGWILKIAYFLETYIGADERQCRRTCVNALMYVVLSKAQKNVPYGEFVGTTECITS